MSVEAWLGIVVALLSVAIGFLGYSLNKQKYILEQQNRVRDETKTDSRQDAKIEAKLEYIGKGVDDIRIDLRANERQMSAFGERITRVEESSKQAHKRIDNLEEGGRLG